MRRSPFSRWIRRDRAERYIKVYGGKIFADRFNGYIVLYSVFREPLAFIRN